MKQLLPSINGLRALSVILVILHHVDIQHGIFDSYYANKYLLPIIIFITDGHLGVNVFFIISGFLITHLMLEEEKAHEKISFKNFYIRRVLRIFPAYFFLLLVYAILQFSGIIHLTNESWLTSITYTKYINWHSDWQTAHAWSLSIEEQFYLVWPFVFICGNRIRKSITIILIIAVPLVRLSIYYHPVNWIDEISIFTRIDAIATGCLIALYKNNIIALVEKHGQKIFYACVFTILYLTHVFSTTTQNNLNVVFIPLGLTHGTLYNFILAYIIMYSIYHTDGLWFRFLNFKFLNYIGLLSYSIYLWQQLFVFKSNYWFNLYPWNLLYVIIAALFSYYMIEKPFLKLKSKF